MRAKNVSESLNFNQGGDPYNKLGVGTVPYIAKKWFNT